MSKGPETNIVRKILERLNAMDDCYAFKCHGNQFQKGQPDVLGCLRGRMLAFEVKVPGNVATPLQLEILSRWKSAGAVTGVVHSWEEVEVLLKEVL